MTVLERLGAAGVVPVVVLPRADEAAPLGAALARGGLPCVEVTLRTPAAVAGIARLAADPELVVGAGTVLDATQADDVVEAGARFVVSPCVDVAVVRRCRALGVPVLPGIATPTEAMTAMAEGLDAVKLFPAGALGGPAMAAALGGPFPRLRLVPTGGIGLADVPSYLGVPNVLAVGGSWVAPFPLVRDRRFDEIARLAAAAVEAVAACRAKQGAPE
ncbi:MAG TPA: bifunctional 4-hydroxy-2-oxoglutarate aldolase/2-dehydro-3-deoxy-phosphogluconate aldolase [Solirubrobacteraceae bacterium]|nr:bifunctional 4-hydroxy-2-oxoglutarate aldolase/2-dehydro-3-deoxy-phosphogluconate aldolase [Solirubrobacteraceae bacterium]